MSIAGSLLGMSDGAGGGKRAEAPAAANTTYLPTVEECCIALARERDLLERPLDGGDDQ
ncbi:hypothetical protein GCM10025865_24510 [Paraoerskovia sediminicola]|uniref:Uncharacterized protein n=1 Tax=Paraoerskovia sediminicola TaxID=1138587 RepID=A0ABN6XE65_9CELL|nr:hypothetical protein [Paraoerskovia sediminicola]BDZ43152.1 hypothetical protein GCM10025865_24510 [Paraoerskovia sediminicola]